MPNWCTTRITFEGPQEVIGELHFNIDKKWAVDVVENGFGNYWLGNMIGNAGLNWQEIRCRGSIIEINDIELKDDGLACFEIVTETAWSPMVEMWYKIFEKLGIDSISVYYSAEEVGLGVYETNDLDGRYYTDKYYLEYSINDESLIEYYDCDRDVLNVLNEILNTDFDCEKTNIDDKFIETCSKIFQEKYGKLNSTNFLTLFRFEYVEEVSS